MNLKDLEINWKAVKASFLLGCMFLSPIKDANATDNRSYILDYSAQSAIYAQQEEVRAPEMLVASNNHVSGSNYSQQQNDMVLVAKVTGNNVNVRLGASMKADIIGFADVTDRFEIVGCEGDWYKIVYLNQYAYINKKYVREESVPNATMQAKKIGYLVQPTNFYNGADKYASIITTLPAYQNVTVIGEEGYFYHVMVDGVIGYVVKADFKELTKTCVIIDLPRQILRVYQNNREVARFHIITGKKETQTDIGCFKIGHRLTDYQLTPTNFVRYWLQYNGDEGIHDASWQKDKYYTDNSGVAYTNFMKGYGRTYPNRHGSHGCDNMREVDARVVYDLVRKGDNVLVVGPNDLVKLHLVSQIIEEYLREYHISHAPLEIETVKIKKLV